MGPIAKEDPHGIVQEVQPVGYYLWDWLQMTPYHKKLQLIVRVAQMWPIAKEDPHGIVQEVQPAGSYFWDGTQVRRYHNKLLEVGI